MSSSTRGRKRSRSSSKTRSRSRGRDRSRDRPPNAKLAEKRVYVSNIPYEFRWQDLKDLFRKEVGEVMYVELFHDENEKPRGCGVIEFETPALAKKAIEKMHRHELSGRKVVVKEDYEVERDKTGRIILPNSRSSSTKDRSRARKSEWERRRSISPSSPWKQGNTYGLSQQFLDGLDIDGPLVPKIFVSNLEFRVDEKKLRDVFRLAGKIVAVDVNKDKEGKSRGHGTIEFDHPVEAVQAISMFNNQELYERRMHVRMDRLSDPVEDLSKGRLPEGLKGIGMGLGQNGQPLIEVSKTLAANSNTVTTSLSSMIGTGGSTNPVQNAIITNQNALAAMGLTGLNVGLINSQNIQDQQQVNNGSFGGLNLVGGGSGGGFNNVGNNVGLGLTNLSSNNLSNIGSSGQSNGLGLNVNQLLAQNQTLIASSPLSSSNTQFQNPNDYGYSTSVYSTPSSNYNTAYQREKQNFGNGSSSSGSLQQLTPPSNTCIISNLPPTCTWQMLKTKFSECGSVVFAEMKDKSTGIVRFNNERDAERAIKVFDQSRVDGRIVQVSFFY